MAHFKYDRVQETSTSTGSSTMTLAGAVTRMRRFGDVLFNTNTCYVLIEHASAAEWQICLATWNTGHSLTLGAVLASSTGAAVSFSAGTKTISMVAPALKNIVEDNNGDASVSRDLYVGNAAIISGNVAADAVLASDLEISGTASVGGNMVSDLKFTDATYDIGKSGATRPRDGFFSRNVTAGNTLGVGGVTQYQPLTMKTGLAIVVPTEAADQKNFDFYQGSSSIQLRFLNDAYSAANAIYSVTRAGYTVTQHAWYTGSSTLGAVLTSVGLGIGAAAETGTKLRLIRKSSG